MTLERYHEQRDDLIGLNADHFNSPNYGRGAVKRYERRSRKTPTATILFRVLLAVLFFALWAFVFFYGLTK